MADITKPEKRGSTRRTTTKLRAYIKEWYPIVDLDRPEEKICRYCGHPIEDHQGIALAGYADTKERQAAKQSYFGVAQAFCDACAKEKNTRQVTCYNVDEPDHFKVWAMRRQYLPALVRQINAMIEQRKNQEKELS